MAKFQRLGYSNKVFFYQFEKRNSFSLRFRYDFVEDIEAGSMKASIEEALKLYPEFRISVRTEGHRFVSEQNDRPVSFYQGLDREHRLGSEETNGYLFYFAYEKKSLRISYYHGMTDTKGVLTFMGTVLYFYAQKTGKTLSGQELEELRGKIRFSEADIPEDEMERLDPYGLLADGKAEQGDPYQNPAASYFTGQQYPEDWQEVNRYEIEFSLSAFLKMTREYGVSVGPLLLSIISRAFRQTEDSDKSRQVVAMLPVDFRKHFGIPSLVNFSDGISVPMEEADLELSLHDLSRKFKEFILGQICRENFVTIIKNKVGMVRSLEDRPGGMEQMVEEMIHMPDLSKFCPASYVFTYPGNLNMGKGIDRMLRDIHYGCFTRYTYVTGSTFNDCFRLSINARTDDGQWAENILNNIKSLGIDAEMKAMGRVKGDIIDVFAG